MPEQPISADQPVLVKDMVVAHAGKNLVNGKDEFDLPIKSLDLIVANFAATGRQIPIYVGGEHFADRADRLADGWVVKLWRKAQDLVARVKLHGLGAEVVAGDMMRGISIGTVDGKDVHGGPLGDVLDHLLITNQPFFGDLNIAASSKQAEGRAMYLTACIAKEAEMPEPEVKTPEDIEEEKENMKPVQKLADGDPPEPDEEEEDEFPEEEFTIANFRKMRRLLRKLRDLQVGLSAENETMKAQLKAKSGIAHLDKEKLAIRLRRLETERNAQNIREYVTEGLSMLTLKSAWVQGYRGDDGDGGQGTLDWILTSKFADKAAPTSVEAAVAILKYQVFNTDPIARLDRDYTAGHEKADSLTLTSEEETLVRQLRMSPESLKAGLKATSAAEFEALTKKES